MNFFHHKDLGNHLLQLCPKVVKHPVVIAEHNLKKDSIFIIRLETNRPCRKIQIITSYVMSLYYYQHQ